MQGSRETPVFVVLVAERLQSACGFQTFLVPDSSAVALPPVCPLPHLKSVRPLGAGAQPPLLAALGLCMALVQGSHGSGRAFARAGHRCLEASDKDEQPLPMPAALHHLQFATPTVDGGLRPPGLPPRLHTRAAHRRGQSSQPWLRVPDPNPCKGLWNRISGL